MAQFPETQPDEVTAMIGFRVECYEETSVFYNAALGRGGVGNMRPRGQDLFSGPNAWSRTLDAHLSHELRRGPTPFISFFRTWEAALVWRRRLLRGGAETVAVLAVWLQGVDCLYDASWIATQLGYIRDSVDIRRQLQAHDEELLLHGSISGEEQRLLATFRGDTPIVDRVTLYPIPSGTMALNFPALMPRGVLEPVPGAEDDLTEALRAEIHSLCGFDSHLRLCTLVLALSGQDWSIAETEDYFCIFIQMTPVQLCLLRFAKD